MRAAFLDVEIFIGISVNMTKEERKEYNKKYWAEHKTELSERAKKYKKEHRAELNAYARQYRQDNLEKIRAQENAAYHKRRENNPELITEQRRVQRKRAEEKTPGIQKKRRDKFFKNNPEKKKEYSDKYCNSKKGRATQLKNSYIDKDQEKGFSTDGNINQKWIIENIFNGQKCIYCGDDDWKHLGADRIDNSKPHTPDNCVCACGICNSERRDLYTVEEFKEYRQLHPRTLVQDEKTWEIVEMSGIKVLKKRTV